MRAMWRAQVLSLTLMMLIGCAGNGSYQAKAAPYVHGPPPQYNQALIQRAESRYAFDDEAVSGRHAVASADSAGGSVLSSGGASASAPPAPPASAAPPAKRSPDERKFVRTASLTLEVSDEEDFQPTLERARAIATRLEGYIQSESTYAMTMLVPTERLSETLAALEKLGEVSHKAIQIVDVTSSYVDLQIRIENLVRLRQRLTELVAQTQDVSEILKIEMELGRVTSQLEQMEGQLRLLQRNTSYATIALRLEESVSPGPLGWVFYGTYRAIKWLFVWD